MAARESCPGGQREGWRRQRENAAVRRGRRDCGSGRGPVCGACSVEPSLAAAVPSAAVRVRSRSGAGSTFGILERRRPGGNTVTPTRLS